MSGIQKLGDPSFQQHQATHNRFPIGSDPKPCQISTNLCLRYLIEAGCQAEQAHAIQVKQTNAKPTDYKLFGKVTPRFLRSTEMPWGALASPSPHQPLQTLHPTQSCRILPRDRFEFDSFQCLSYFSYSVTPAALAHGNNKRDE